MSEDLNAQSTAQEKRSEFRTLDQFVKNGFASVSEAINLLQNDVNRIGDMSPPSYGVGEDYGTVMQRHFFEAHDEYLSALRHAERIKGQLDTIADYSKSVREMGGKGEEEAFFEDEKRKLDFLRGDIVAKLESIIHSPAGAEIIKIAEKKNEKGLEI